MRRQQGDLAWLLVLGSPGLLLVDHIHFQYNGMLLGEGQVCGWALHVPPRVQ